MTTDKDARIATAAWLAVALIGGALLILTGVLLALVGISQVIAWALGVLGGLAIGGAILAYQAYRGPR